MADLLTQPDGQALGWRLGTPPRRPLSAVRLDSPLGTLEILASARGIVACRFADRVAPDTLDDRPGPASEHARHAADQLDEYFRGRRRHFDVPLDLRGTPFQIEAWRTLCEIPFGAVITYGEQAARMGRPDAARAVGGANAANPIAILVPCHRVVASGGRLWGYAAGVERKRALLALELGPRVHDLAPSRLRARPV
jgi:methylated-DNA-[protein]-cysteine S-methyltransferase